jgi:polyhydroxyalkanoate synthesis regulator phasin
MSDREFKKFVRSLLADLREANGEKDKEKQHAKIEKIIDNLQQLLKE